jgi:hypothetical protein
MLERAVLLQLTLLLVPLLLLLLLLMMMSRYEGCGWLTAVAATTDVATRASSSTAAQHGNAWRHTGQLLNRSTTEPLLLMPATVPRRWAVIGSLLRRLYDKHTDVPLNG